MGKACGPNKITGKELQMLVDVFIDNFLNIAKKSFDDCMFSSQWKTAQVLCIVFIKWDVLKNVEITVLFHFYVY